MQCPECEALPEIDYPEADLYFWLPLAHTHSKIAALLEDSNLQFEDLGHQALRVSIHDADMRPFLLRVRGALTGQELSNANAMALPRGEEPGPSNFSKVISLSKLIGLSSGKWLRGLVFGTLEPLSDLDQKVAFGDIQLSYENEPFQSMMKQLAAEGTSLAGMEKVPGLAELSPWTRAEAARLLAAGGQVMCFAGETAAVKVPKGAKLSMPPVNRGMIKDLGLVLPRIALAAPLAGTGIELPNIDAILLLARCEKGPDGAVKSAAKVLSFGEGEVVIGGKELKAGEVEALLSKRLQKLEETMLDKLAEIGVVSIEN